MSLRIDTIKEIKGIAPALAVEEGGTGGKTPADARKGLGFEDLGIGLPSQLVSPPFDWQQADFAIGQTQLVNVTGWLNAPAELKNPVGDVASILCEVARTNVNRFAVRVVSQAMTATARYEYFVVMNGVKGSRTFNVVQEFNSDPTTVIPIANGGTGGRTSAEARVNLELNVRAIVGDKNLNEIGPLQEGMWGQSSVTYATSANGYPAVERGILEFFRGGRNNGTQQYTTEAGRIFTRFLAAAWNGTDGPWGDWLEVAGLSSNKVLPAATSLSDYAAFAQNQTYILSGARDDLPAGINGNCTIMSVRRAGGTIAALNQLLFTSVGLFYRTGSPNSTANWTSITWYAGGDANGWRLVGMEAMRSIGIGVETSPLITNFDWQQADFIVGSLQVAQFGGFKNAPEGLAYNSTTSITIETLQSRGTLWVVKLIPLTISPGNKSEYTVVVIGAKGERTFQATQNFNSDAPVPLTSGGHGGKTPAEARVNLELNTRSIADNKNINEIGPSLDGRWAKTTNGATLANGYPEDGAVGILEVFAGGSFGGTQIFTARSGIDYSRFLTAAWNGKDGPWSAWTSSKEDAPFPDVWAPLNDDLRLLAGFAPRDKLTIGDQTVELPSKSMTFTRASTATYIDKMGVLQTAAVNEPRFERAGLLLEGHSTNNILNSEEPLKWGSQSTLDKQVIVDGSTQATTFKGTVNAATSSNHLVINSTGVTAVVGDVFTLSARIKATSDKIRFRFTIDGNEKAQAFFNGVTGEFISASTSLSCTVVPQSDGYAYISVTYTPDAAGVVNGNIWFNGAAWIAIGQSIYAQTVQFEKNPVATSYIPTGAAAATRAIENASIPAERNIGYRQVGEKFNRTLAFELSVERFSPPSASYFDAIRGLNANNDIIVRIMDTSLRSYRAGGGPVININTPFTSKTYVQTIDTTDRLSLFMDGKTDSVVGGPTTATTSATNLNFAAHPNVVYHVRNFRLWQRLLSASQVRGLR